MKNHSPKVLYRIAIKKQRKEIRLQVKRAKCKAKALARKLAREDRRKKLVQRSLVKAMSSARFIYGAAIDKMVATTLQEVSVKAKAKRIARTAK